MPPVWLLVVLCGLAPGSDEAHTSGRQERPAAPVLSHYDLDKPPLLRLTLPSALGEISGLAMTPDGRLLCHDDENGVVYQVDYHTGAIVKRFGLGSGFLEEDFEGVAAVGEMVYLVTSSGNLLEFREGKDRGNTPFQIYRTFLSRKNDVEGLEFDPDTGTLLLACKGDPGEGLGNVKAVYAFSLTDKTLRKEPRFVVRMKELDKDVAKRGFNPSGIARHPAIGSFVIISADGRWAVELDRKGTLVAQRAISSKHNPQPEGITFAPDLSMIICNDGQGGKGTITVYPAQGDEQR
jgi:uncharacterized protein YjiK